MVWFGKFVSIGIFWFVRFSLEEFNYVISKVILSNSRTTTTRTAHQNQKGCTRRLKFDTKTTHGLLAEFRGLGVRMTHVTRRTRMTKKNSNVQ